MRTFLKDKGTDERWKERKNNWIITIIFAIVIGITTFIILVLGNELVDKIIKWIK